MAEPPIANINSLDDFITQQLQLEAITIGSNSYQSYRNFSRSLAPVISRHGQIISLRLNTKLTRNLPPNLDAELTRYIPCHLSFVELTAPTLSSTFRVLCGPPIASYGRLETMNSLQDQWFTFAATPIQLRNDQVVWAISVLDTTALMVTDEDPANPRIRAIFRALQALPNTLTTHLSVNQLSISGQVNVDQQPSVKYANLHSYKQQPLDIPLELYQSRCDAVSLTHFVPRPPPSSNGFVVLKSPVTYREEDSTYRFFVGSQHLPHLNVKAPRDLTHDWSAEIKAPIIPDMPFTAFIIGSYNSDSHLLLHLDFRRDFQHCSTSPVVIALSTVSTNVCGSTALQQYLATINGGVLKSTSHYKVYPRENALPAMFVSAASSLVDTKIWPQSTTISMTKESLATPTYGIISYKPNLRTCKMSTDEEFYDKYPSFRMTLPRGSFAITHGDSILRVGGGMRKFYSVALPDAEFGEDSHEDDPVATENEDFEADQVSSRVAQEQATGTLLKWLANSPPGELFLTKTSKANGKLAMFTLLEHHGQLVIAGGSKHNHIAGLRREMDGILSSCNSLLKEMIKSFLTHLDQILECSELRNLLVESGYTLLAEFCDGCHIEPAPVPINETEVSSKLVFFGLFKEGLPYPVAETLQLLREAGLTTVTSCGPTQLSLTNATFEDVEKSFREEGGEGSVLYIEHRDTNECLLFKVKNVGYIFKRILRELLTSKGGYQKLAELPLRIVDRQHYHKLNTMAAIRLTNELIEFSHWMLCNGYPASLLSHDHAVAFAFLKKKEKTSIPDATRHLKHGFSHYWSLFLNKSGAANLLVDSEDFIGGFDANEFLCHYEQSTKLLQPQSNAKRPYILMLQGIQGSGKSTLASSLIEVMTAARIVQIEQDLCHGDFYTCRDQLRLHATCATHDYIIVSRCNSRMEDYERLTNTAHACHCPVIFLTPKILDERYLTLAVCNALNRSGEPKATFGPTSSPLVKSLVEFEAMARESFDHLVEDCRVNFPRPTLCFDTFTPTSNEESTLLDHLLDLDSEWRKIQDRVTNFIQSTRISSPDIAHSIRDQLEGTSKEQLVAPAPAPYYISLDLTLRDHMRLRDLMRQKSTTVETKFNEECTHVTQIYTVQGSSDIVLPPIAMKQGEQVKATIDRLVFDVDGSCVFHVCELVKADDGSGVITQNKIPHITGRMKDKRMPAEALEILAKWFEQEAQKNKKKKNSNKSAKDERKSDMVSELVDFSVMLTARYHYREEERKKREGEVKGKLKKY